MTAARVTGRSRIRERARQRPTRPAPEPPRQPIVAEVDGRRLVIEAEDELVLRCGKASITLRRNGRVVIEGVQLESRAAGANKIRGGSVQIN